MCSNYEPSYVFKSHHEVISFRGIGKRNKQMNFLEHDRLTCLLKLVPFYSLTGEKKKTTPGPVTAVQNKFKNKNPIAKTNLVGRSAFRHGRASTWVKPTLIGDYTDDRN